MSSPCFQRLVLNSICFWLTANSLLEMFKNDDLKDLYEDTIDALVQVAQFPRMYMLGYFDAFMGRLLDVMEGTGMSNDQLTGILPYFTELVANSTHNTSPFLKRSLQLIADKYSMEMSISDLIIACEQKLPKVRINSLNTLITMTESVDSYTYLGPMVRALHFPIKSKNVKTADVDYEPLTAILKTHGTELLTSAGPLPNSLRRANLERPELSQLVSEVQQGKYGDGFKFVSKGQNALPPKKEVQTHSFSEEVIVGRVKSSNLGP